MNPTTKLFDQLIEKYRKADNTEASVDFTINGVDFTVSIVDDVFTLWYNDEPQETAIHHDWDTREDHIAWLHLAIGNAIQ